MYYGRVIGLQYCVFRKNYPSSIEEFYITNRQRETDEVKASGQVKKEKENEERVFSRVLPKHFRRIRKAWAGYQ